MEPSVYPEEASVQSPIGWAQIEYATSAVAVHVITP